MTGVECSAGLDGGPQGRAALLLLMNIGAHQSSIGRNDVYEPVRGILGQSHFVDALPNANTLFSRLEARGLFGKIHSTPLGGFGLLMYQPGSEVHHRIFA
jgi:hypothetical protein